MRPIDADTISTILTRIIEEQWNYRPSCGAKMDEEET